MWYHEEAYITDSSPENREVKTSSEILALVFSYTQDSEKIDEIQSIIGDNNPIYNITDHGRYIFIDGKTDIIIDRNSLNWESDLVVIEWSDRLELESQIQEDISWYNERILQLDIMKDSIQICLETNAQEIMWEIGEEDIINQWPLQWMWITEAVLTYRRHLAEMNSYHAMIMIDPDVYEIQESYNQFYDMQEYYLSLALGIWDNNEALVDVIPKTMEEMIWIINLVVARRSIPEIFEYMHEVHAIMDDNEFQSSTVKKNYAFFTDTLNEVVLMRLKNEVSPPSDEIMFSTEVWEYKNNASILYQFANFVSWRTRWYEAQMFLHDWLLWLEDQSRMSEDLRRPEIANVAIAYAMDIPTQSPEWEDTSLIETIMPHLDIQDPLLEWREPVEVIATCISTITAIYSQLWIPWTDDSPSEANEINSKALLRAYWYEELIDNFNHWNLSDYKSLSLKQLTEVSALARIQNSLKNEISVHHGSYQLQEWEEFVAGHTNVSVIRTPWKLHDVNLEQFQELMKSSAEWAIEHIWSELDRNFDDSWSEVWTDTLLNSSEESQNKRRAREFWITDTNSLHYEMFTLYNDLNWNGWLWEVSDTNRGRIKTGWEILATVAGAMIIWWAAISAIQLWRSIYTWVRISQAAQLSVQTQWVLYGLSWSAWSYWIDYIQWDALWFWSTSEAITWLATDFTIWWLTWWVWGMLAAKYWNPEALFFSRANIRNQQIFAWDLAALGLAPEMVRIALLERLYHNSEIFTDWEDPVSWEISKTMLSNLELYGYANIEMAQEYIENPNSPNLSPYLRGFRFFSEQFSLMGLDNSMISPEFDVRFQKAYAIWRLLNPEEDLNLFQVLPGMDSAIVLDETWINGVHERILVLVTEWIKLQESRLHSITPQ